MGSTLRFLRIFPSLAEGTDPFWWSTLAGFPLSEIFGPEWEIGPRRYPGTGAWARVGYFLTVSHSFRALSGRGFLAELERGLCLSSRLHETVLFLLESQV